MILQSRLPSLLGFDAITIWPLIFIAPMYAQDEALLSHEMVHYTEQRRWWVLPWWIMYLASRRFRFEAEVRGYAEQVRRGALITWAAQQISQAYRTGRSQEQALAALQDTQKTGRELGVR